MDKRTQTLIMKMGFVAFVIMVITGFLPLIMGEKVLSGWWMISHATVAPIFSILMAIGALLWVKSTGNGFKDTDKSKCTKKIVWVFLILFIPNALSILFSMNTWFPSATQQPFLSVHFYTAIGMLLFAILYLNISRKKNN